MAAVSSAGDLADFAAMTSRENPLFLTCPCHEIYRDEAVGL